MTTGHAFMATSLDGFIARKNHDLDWLPTEGEEMGYQEFVSKMDGLIMGRGTFEKVLTFEKWPYQKPVVVLSRTIQIPAELRGKVKVSNQEPKELMETLHEEGWHHAYVDGGQVIQSFIRAGLIEDLTITVIPVLIGDGRRLFGEVDHDIPLELMHSKSFDSGIVQNQYRIVR